MPDFELSLPTTPKTMSHMQNRTVHFATPRYKRNTVRQAIFIPNHRVCTLCTGFRPPILPPYRITSSATSQPLCVSVRVRVPVCASARVRVRLSVCLRVRLRVCLRVSASRGLSRRAGAALYGRLHVYLCQRKYIYSDTRLLGYKS